MVEGKGADVRLFILFSFLQTLFELPFLLKPMLLSHLALFFFRLDDATLMAEILQFAIEHLVSAEFALQTAVIERNLDAGFQTNLLETLLTIGENPCIIAFELMFQTFSNHAVRTQQIRC